MHEISPSVDKMGTIHQAIFVERSTNPNCPQANQIIEALQTGDVDLAYQMALDTLTPKESPIKRLIHKVQKIKFPNHKPKASAKTSSH